jgi:hypothetical protein
MRVLECYVLPFELRVSSHTTCGSPNFRKKETCCVFVYALTSVSWNYKCFVRISIYLPMALEPFVGPWQLFNFLIFTQSVDSLEGESARQKAAIYTQDSTHTHTQNKRIQPSVPQVGFESTIPAFKRAKTVHALASTDTDRLCMNMHLFYFCINVPTTQLLVIINRRPAKCPNKICNAKDKL